MLRETNNPKMPPDDTVIWRYMRLERFLSLIASGSLRVARLDSFRDPWEGRWPKAVMEKFKDVDLSRTAAKVKFIIDPNLYRTTVFASCWHASRDESAALWQIYSGNAGIAIRSTVRKLRAALKENSTPHFFIGAVQYVDFKTETVEAGSLVKGFLKRKSFAHEQEIRVLILGQNPQHPDVHFLNCDLNALLEEVYLSPESDDSMKTTVESVLAKYDLEGVSVHRSTLYDTSVY
jgi:hypothetical protein